MEIAHSPCYEFNLSRTTSKGTALKSIPILLLFALALFGTAVSSFGASASATLPLDDPAYAALEKLAGFGLLDSDLQGSRPWTRLEAARLVAEALTKSAQTAAPPVTQDILSRLRRQFAPQLDELNGAAAGSYFQPIRSLRLDYIYQEGVPTEQSRPGLIARQFPLNSNNFGIDYREHHNLQASLESEARWGRYFLVDWRPLLVLDESQSELTTLEGKAALALGPFEISVGRQALWWGQGRHGSLVLTNNAKPLDMLRITNPSPIRLPWVLHYLGDFRFDVFWSELENQTVLGADERLRDSDIYFAGLRLDFKPLPWLELGASRTVMFGGKGRPAVDLADFLTILSGKNLSGGEDTSNQLAAIDARLRLPFLWGAQVYGELGGEDEAGAFISKHALLGGIYLPRIEPTGRLDLRLEYADLDFQGNGPVWYRHGYYRSGYTHEGKIIGHAAGGDAVDYFAELSCHLPQGTKLAFAFELLKQGLSQPIVKNTRCRPCASTGRWPAIPCCTPVMPSTG